MEDNAFKVSLLRDESIKGIYQKRLTRKLMNLPMVEDIDEEWDNLCRTIEEGVDEAVCMKSKLHKRRGPEDLEWEDIKCHKREATLV